MTTIQEIWNHFDIEYCFQISEIQVKKNEGCHKILRRGN